MTNLNGKKPGLILPPHLQKKAPTEQEVLLDMLAMLNDVEFSLVLGSGPDAVADALERAGKRGLEIALDAAVQDAKAVLTVQRHFARDPASPTGMTIGESQVLRVGAAFMEGMNALVKRINAQQAAAETKGGEEVPG